MGTCNDKDKVVCDVANLAVNEVVTLTIVVSVKKKSGSITNSASVQSDVPDPQAANNLGTETTQVTELPGPAGPTCEAASRRSSAPRATTRSPAPRSAT